MTSTGVGPIYGPAPTYFVHKDLDRGRQTVRTTPRRTESDRTPTTQSGETVGDPK